MPRCTLQMTCDNAAFEGDNLTLEVCGILRDVATRVLMDGMRDSDFYQTVRDSNGNDVGRFRLAINRQD